MNRMIASLLVSMAVVLLCAPKLIAWLHKLHFGQTIYDKVTPAHQKKAGTPTMGGLIVAAAVVLCALALHPKTWNGGWDFMLALVAVSLGSMAVGFLDDFTKVHKKRSEGLTPRQKIIGQIFVAAAFSVYCYFHPLVGSKVLVPFLNIEWDLGIFYIPLMFLLIIFMVNSSNLLDGLDGLLCTTVSVGSAGWGLMALVLMTITAAAGQPVIDSYYAIGIFAMALCGACMAFLRFNCYPAKVFLGDTGSMFIGGATVGMALLMRQPLMLLLIAFTMIISSVSVIMQRTYFKLTHGKRIFKMSPLHHHFELSGYSETQIDTMYAVVTAVLSVIAVLSLNGLQL